MSGAPPNRRCRCLGGGCSENDVGTFGSSAVGPFGRYHCQEGLHEGRHEDHRGVWEHYSDFGCHGRFGVGGHVPADRVDGSGKAGPAVDGGGEAVPAGRGRGGGGGQLVGRRFHLAQRPLHRHRELRPEHNRDAGRRRADGVGGVRFVGEILSRGGGERLWELCRPDQPDHRRVPGEHDGQLGCRECRGGRLGLPHGDHAAGRVGAADRRAYCIFPARGLGQRPNDRVLVAALLLAALASPWLVGTVVSRSITTRLRRTVKVLEQVATGDLTKRIGVDSSDEVGQMGTAVNAGPRRRRRAHAGTRSSRAGWPTLLDMADGEAEVMTVIERSFAMTPAHSPIELLLADNSHAHLQRMATPRRRGTPGVRGRLPGPLPGGPAGPGPAFQRQRSTRRLSQAPGRADGACPALCVPVSIMGRTVGVIHATGTPDRPVRRTPGVGPGDAGQAGWRPDRPAPGDVRDTASSRHRQAHRAAQPALIRAEGAGLGPTGRPGGLGHGRPGPFQSAQRHLRPATGDRALVLFAKMLRSRSGPGPDRPPRG